MKAFEPFPTGNAPVLPQDGVVDVGFIQSEALMKENNHVEHHHHHDQTGAGSGEHAHHDKHAGHSVEMFRNKFWVCLVLAIPALIWEPMLQEWFRYQAPVFPGSEWIPAIFGTLVFLYGGWIFVKGAIHELADRMPGMMTLIALAIGVAFICTVMECWRNRLCWIKTAGGDSGLT